jgi:hypothetical protein
MNPPMPESGGNLLPKAWSWDLRFTSLGTHEGATVKRILSAVIIAGVVGCGGAAGDSQEASSRTAAHETSESVQALCAGGPAITIESAAWDNPHTSLTGLYVTVQQSGTTLATGWTPLTIPDLCAGQQYTITAADYQNNRFAHWEDGTTTWFRSVNIETSAAYTAYYQVGGSIIPLYSWPTDIQGKVTSAWNSVASAHQRWPRIAVIPIVNNQNGPGPSLDPSWTKGIRVLASAGCKVAGYVYTQYGRRSLTDVETDIRNWRIWYPEVTALFLDQMSNASGDESYYSALTSYARSRGFDFVIGNPGASTVPSYIGTVDTMVIHESTEVPTSFSAWQASYSPNHFGALTYANASSLPAGQVTSNKSSVAYQYITDDGIPPDWNPWDELSTQLDALLSLLNG